MVVQLKNISGGEQYRAVLLSLFERPYDKAERWNATGLTLDNRFLPLDTDALLDCTFQIDFGIEHDYGDPRHWFGVRLRGRGEADHIFDGCLVYLRRNGNLDVAILGKIVEIEQVVERAVNVNMRISIIDNRLTVSINGKPCGGFSADGLLRSGRVYLLAAKTKVSIKSAQLLSEETI